MALSSQSEGTRRAPPCVSCERCQLPLPDGADPLRRSPAPVGRRHSGDFHPPSPIRVSRPGPDGETSVAYWCSSRCFKEAHAKPDQKREKGKPTPDQHMHLGRPWAA
jgi:hypothetical protein